MRNTARLLRILLVATVASGEAQAAGEAFSPVSRTSRVWAYSYESTLSLPPFQNDTQEDSFTGIGLYEKTVIAGEQSVGRAHQRSAVLGDGAAVLLEAEAEYPLSSLGYKSALSTFELVFDAAEPAVFDLTGHVGVVDIAPPYARQPYGEIALKGPGVDIDVKIPEDTPFSYHGPLHDGRYTLTLTAFAREAWYCSASIEASFRVVPEPGGLLILTAAGLLMVRSRSRILVTRAARPCVDGQNG